MSRRIQRLNVGAVEVGMSIVQEDDDKLTTSELVNENYDHAEQDWHTVVRAKHRADQSQLTLAMYNGEEYQTGWADGIVWVLFDGDEPVFEDSSDWADGDYLHGLSLDI